MALKVGELYASFGIDSKGISKDISSIEKQCTSIGKGLAITGAALTASVTKPVVSAAKDIIKTGSNFGYQMSRVKSISGATEDEFKELRAEALRMAAGTSFTAQQTGEALEYMGMAGWEADKMIAGLPAILDLAAASGEDLGTVSDIVTDALTAFGLKAEDASRFADILAATSTSANTNVSMMGESFKYIAPLAGSMGYSIDDMAVALGLMANAGIKGTMAGTSLRNIIQNMQKPTKDQAEAMKTLGLSLYDAKGGAKSFSKIMKEMRQAARKAGIDTTKLHDTVKEYDKQLAAGTLTQDEYDAKLSELTEGSEGFMKAVSELAGARGLSGMLAIMNASDEDFDKLVENIRNSEGAAQSMADMMLDNLYGDMVRFDSALDVTKVGLSDLLSDGLRPIVRQATDYVNAFNDMDESTKLLTMKMAGLAAAAGPAMAAVGGLIAGLPKVAPALKAIISPAGIAAGSLALFAIAAVDADNKVGQAFEGFAEKAAASLESSQADIESYISTVSDRIPALAASITSGFGKLVPAVVGVAGSIVSSFIKVVSDNANDVSQIGVTLVTGLVNSIATEIEKHDMIAETATMLTNLSIAFIKNTPKIFNAGIRLGSAIIRGIKNTNWGQLAVDLGNAIVEAAGGVDLPALEGLATDIVDAISAGMNTKNFQGIRTFIGGLAQKIADFDWNEVADNGKKIATDLITAIGNGITTAGDNARTIIEAIGNILTGNFGTSFIPAATKIAISVIQGIADQIPKLVRTAGKIITSLGDLIKDIPWSEAGTAVGEIATSLVDELVKTINSEDFDVAGIITGLGDALIAAATGLATAAGSLITKLVEYLTNEENLKSIGDAADKVLSGFAKGIADVIPGFGENAEIIKAAIEGIGVSLLVLKGAAMVSNIASIISGIGTSFGGLLGAINPVGLAISLVASTILYFWNTSEEFRDAIIAIWEGIKSGIKDSIEGITGFFKDLAEATKTAIAFLKDPNGMWDQMQAQMNGNMTYNPNIVFNPNFIVPADDEAFDNKMNDVLASMFSENGKQDMTVSFGLDYDPSKNDSNLESEVQKTAQEIVDSATKTDFTGKQGELDALMAKYAELETKASESMTQVQTTATEHASHQF